MNAAAAPEIWPIHLPPLHDELLTSWILRLAKAYGLKVHPFCVLMFGKKVQIWNRDFDRLASDDFLQRLGMSTGVGFDAAKQTTLRDYEGIVFEKHNPTGNTKWILPLGIYHRTRRDFGQQFCPLCLAEDREPYYRRKWRLAFYTMCDRHLTLMHDRCPKCGSPVMFYRGELGHRNRITPESARLCHSCGFDLSRAAAWSGEWDDWESFSQFINVLTLFDLGWIVSKERTFQFGHLYFDVLHQVCKMLQGRRVGARFREVVFKESGISEPRLPVVDSHVLERLSIRERHLLVGATIWLLQDWPERFEWAFHSANLRATDALRDLVRGPFWFESAIREDLSFHHQRWRN